MSAKNITITKEMACKILLTYIEKKKPSIAIFEVSETLPTRCNPYGLPTEDCWFIVYSVNKPPGLISASSVAAISKKTGKVIYDGSANDEG